MTVNVVASWGSHQFIVSPELIRGFSDMTLKASLETETKTSGSEQYVTRKVAKPVEGSMTALLNAHTGCDVRADAEGYLASARNGESDYLYVGEKKLFTGKLMLTDASVTEVQLTPGGKWVSAKVQLTFKQASKEDGSTSSSTVSSGGSGSSSKKASVKKSTTVKVWSNPAALALAAFSKVSGTKSTVSTSLSKAQSQIAKLTKTAKKTTAVAKARSKAKKKLGR